MKWRSHGMIYPYGHLQINQEFHQSENSTEIRHTFIPRIEYQFNKSIGLTEAFERIAAVRNLFSFFANSYLPFENIKFVNEHSDKDVASTLRNIILYLNY